VAWPPIQDCDINGTVSSLSLIIDWPKDATRMKPEKEDEGKIDVPKRFWTLAWTRIPGEKSNCERAITSGHDQQHPVTSNAREAR
jgi:hypothetical protein